VTANENLPAGQNREVDAGDSDKEQPTSPVNNPPESSFSPPNSKKLNYIETIKILLTVMVIVFHSMIGFTGAAGPNVPFQIGNYYHPFQVFCVSTYLIGQCALGFLS